MAAQSPLEICLPEAHKPLVDPGRIENRQVKIERCTDPQAKTRVIREVIVRERMRERGQSGVADDVLDAGPCPAMK